jgi:hypothetical protein
VNGVDKEGIAFGVLLSLAAQVMYDTLFYYYSGKFLEEWIAAICGTAVVVIVLLIFLSVGVLRKKEKKQR